MNFIVHYPESIEGKELLSRKLCEAHLTMVAKHINALPIPYNQKESLFEAVCDKIEKYHREK